MEACFSQLTLDVIGKAVFNYDFDALTMSSPVIQVLQQPITHPFNPSECQCRDLKGSMLPQLPLRAGSEILGAETGNHYTCPKRSSRAGTASEWQQQEARCVDKPQMRRRAAGVAD